MKQRLVSVLAILVATLVITGCSVRGEEISLHIEEAVEESKTNNDPLTGWVYVSSVLSEYNNGDESTTYTYMKCDNGDELILIYTPVGFVGNHQGKLITKPNSPTC